MIYCRSALTVLDSAGWKSESSQILWGIISSTGESKAVKHSVQHPQMKCLVSRNAKRHFLDWTSGKITVFPVVSLLVFFVGLVFLFIFLKFIPLEKYVLIKLFIPTNYNVFHGLDHPALFLANIRVQFHSRYKRIDSVSATPGVNPMIRDTINEFYPRCMKRYVSL